MEWSEHEVNEPTGLSDDGVFLSEGAAVQAALSAAAGNLPEPGVSCDADGFSVTFSEPKVEAVEVKSGGVLDTEATAELRRILVPAAESGEHIRTEELAFFPDANIVVWRHKAYTTHALYAPVSVKRKRTFRGIHKKRPGRKISFGCT